MVCRSEVAAARSCRWRRRGAAEAPPGSRKTPVSEAAQHGCGEASRRRKLGFLSLPAGAFSLLAGSVGSLTSHLEPQDVLAFTGGSSTGKTLRALEAVVGRAVRLNVEADSLNAAVLGPDVEIGSDLENLFTADVTRDIQQKTGQKCTAIRRVYVPRERLGEIADLLAERLRGIKVGVPSRDDVTMGPLATKNQLRDVREGARKIAACAKLVLGDIDKVTVLGRDEGEKGFFVSPLLFVNDSPSADDVIHTHEVFGPCATAMPRIAELWNLASSE